jgi:hypothetical protein
MLRRAQKERQEAIEPAETGEGTLVLTLPRKKEAAEDKEDKSERKEKKQPVKVKVVHRRISMLVGPKGKHQIRHGDGQMGTKCAGFWESVMATAAPVVGGIGTAAIVNKLYQRYMEKKLEKKLDAAKREYLDALVQQKQSEYLETTFTAPGLEKQAFTLGDVIPAFWLLGSAGTAWLTKKILDKKLKERQEEELDIPRVQRIVFRTAPQLEEGEKAASASDMETLRGAFAVIMDRVDTDNHILDQDEVKQAMEKIGTTHRELFQMSRDDRIFDFMAKHADFRRTLNNAAIKAHPILQKYGWDVSMQTRSILEALVNKKANAIQKRAILGTSVGDVLGGYLGGAMADDDSQVDADQLANALIKVREKQLKQKYTQKTPAARAAEIKLEAKDPAAQEYLSSRKDQIREMLRQMIAEQKL